MLAAVLGIALPGCTESKPSFNAVDLTGADYAKDFALNDADGKVAHAGRFQGQGGGAVLRLSPSAPTSARPPWPRWRRSSKQLGTDGDKLQVLFVTVDPERDTPEVHEGLHGRLRPGFVALIPTPEQLAALAKDFKVYYKKVEGKTPTSYSMDHSAASFVYDPQGRLRLYARYGSRCRRWWRT